MAVKRASPSDKMNVTMMTETGKSKKNSWVNPYM